MSVYEKLYKIQQQLKAPKGQYNNFGNYKYRSLEDIQEAAKPILSECKAVTTLSDELVLVGGRYYVKATATLTDIETGEQIVVTASAREEETKKGMDGSQITGASSSYARKYALNGLYAIDDTQDSDATNAGDTPTAKQHKKAAADTPVSMTYEQACAVEITFGKYKGKTLKEVKETDQQYLSWIAENAKVESNKIAANLVLKGE